jgi:hypothetical protein
MGAPLKATRRKSSWGFLQVETSLLRVIPYPRRMAVMLKASLAV